MLENLLGRFTRWCAARNAPGFYAGVDDKRWAYTIGTDGSPYMTRVLFPWRIFGVRPMLHEFHRPDIDEHLHNHPWRWCLSVVLWGSYDETRVDPDADDLVKLAGGHPENFTETRRVRWFNWLTDADYHKIEQLHGRVFTLFITGPRIQDWGFRVKGKHVPWRDYFTRRKGT